VNPRLTQTDQTLRTLTATQGWQMSFRLPDGTVTREMGALSVGVAGKLAALQALDLSGLRVLDMGCSEGLYAFYAAAQGASEVVGVDIDPHRIDKARFVAERLGMDQVRFEVGNVLDPAYRDTLPEFDLVLAWGFLHRVPDPFNALIALGSISRAMSLEWDALAVPFASRLSLASHPRGGDFEWKNVAGMTREQVRENAKGKQVDRASFWHPTPGAVQAITRRLGFTRFVQQDRYRGQRGERVREMSRRTAAAALGRAPTDAERGWFRKRVILLCEREPGAVLPLDRAPADRPRFVASWHHVGPRARPSDG
jgi:SAM-dependent methyltransferase